MDEEGNLYFIPETDLVKLFDPTRKNEPRNKPRCPDIHRAPHPSLSTMNFFFATAVNVLEVTHRLPGAEQPHPLEKAMFENNKELPCFFTISSTGIAAFWNLPFSNSKKMFWQFSVNDEMLSFVLPANGQAKLRLLHKSPQQKSQQKQQEPPLTIVVDIEFLLDRRNTLAHDAPFGYSIPNLENNKNDQIALQKLLNQFSRAILFLRPATTAFFQPHPNQQQQAGNRSVSSTTNVSNAARSTSAVSQSTQQHQQQHQQQQHQHQQHQQEQQQQYDDDVEEDEEYLEDLAAYEEEIATNIFYDPEDSLEEFFNPSKKNLVKARPKRPDVIKSSYNCFAMMAFLYHGGVNVISVNHKLGKKETHPLERAIFERNGSQPVLLTIGPTGTATFWSIPVNEKSSVWQFTIAQEMLGFVIAANLMVKLRLKSTSVTTTGKQAGGDSPVLIDVELLIDKPRTKSNPFGGYMVANPESQKDVIAAQKCMNQFSKAVLFAKHQIQCFHQPPPEPPQPPEKQPTPQNNAIADNAVNLANEAAEKKKKKAEKKAEKEVKKLKKLKEEEALKQKLLQQQQEQMQQLQMQQQQTSATTGNFPASQNILPSPNQTNTNPYSTQSPMFQQQPFVQPTSSGSNIPQFQNHQQLEHHLKTANDMNLDDEQKQKQYTTWLKRNERFVEPVDIQGFESQLRQTFDPAVAVDTSAAASTKTTEIQTAKKQNKTNSVNKLSEELEDLLDPEGNCTVSVNSKTISDRLDALWAPDQMELAAKRVEQQASQRVLFNQQQQQPNNFNSSINNNNIIVDDGFPFPEERRQLRKFYDYYDPAKTDLEIETALVVWSGRHQEMWNFLFGTFGPFPSSSEKNMFLRSSSPKSTIVREENEQLKSRIQQLEEEIVKIRGGGTPSTYNSSNINNQQQQQQQQQQQLTPAPRGSSIHDINNNNNNGNSSSGDYDFLGNPQSNNNNNNRQQQQQLYPSPSPAPPLRDDSSPLFSEEGEEDMSYDEILEYLGPEAAAAHLNKNQNTNRFTVDDDNNDNYDSFLGPSPKNKTDIYGGSVQSNNINNNDNNNKKDVLDISDEDEEDDLPPVQRPNIRDFL